MDEHNDIVIIDLDRPRELRLTHHAMKRFAALTGCKMSELQDTIDDYDNLIRLLYVMLSEDDPEITPDRVEELIGTAERRRDKPLKLKTLIAVVSNALIEAFGDEDEIEPEGDEVPPTAAGTGNGA